MVNFSEIKEDLIKRKKEELIDFYDDLKRDPFFQRRYNSKDIASFNENSEEILSDIARKEYLGYEELNDYKERIKKDSKKFHELREFYFVLSPFLNRSESIFEKIVKEYDPKRDLSELENRIIKDEFKYKKDFVAHKLFRFRRVEQFSNYLENKPNKTYSDIKTTFYSKYLDYSSSDIFMDGKY